MKLRFFYFYSIHEFCNYVNLVRRFILYIYDSLHLTQYQPRQ